MPRDTDEERIRQKAHELWEAEGRPHGKDADHWIQAREIIAIEDSQGSTLLPRDTGVEEPIEEAEEALRNLADFPNLTDQGENLLTSTDREPSFGSESSNQPDLPSVEVPISDQPGVPKKTPASERPKTAKSAAAPKPAQAPASKPATASKGAVAPAAPAAKVVPLGSAKIEQASKKGSGTPKKKG